MEIKEIAEMPTTFNNVHESIYRSYHILNLVLEMIERGDSKETINLTVGYLKQQPEAFKVTLKTQIDIFKETKIEDLDISFRCYNVLRSINYNLELQDSNYKKLGFEKLETVSYLLKYNKKQYYKVRNFGKKSMNEIEDILIKYDLRISY